MTAPTWLELLLRDASVEELDEHRARLAPTPEAEAEARRAVQLHALLHDLSRRAAELRALSQMAARISSVRDLRELLQDIAVHARQLLGTDIAYLALAEGDALRIRYFDGTLGPAARDIELSLTAGLAGRIYTHGRAASTQDYLADTTIEHNAAADSFAADERLSSILGVPLRTRGRTLGVLFAAERAVRRFNDADAGLLAGLAGHAAVAIENARLFDAERSSSAELRAANERLELNAAAVDRAVVLHERLTETVVRGGGVTEVVQALSDVLAAPVQLVDAADRPLAGPALADGSGTPSPTELVAAAGGRRALVLPPAGGESLVLCPVVAAEDYLGCLVVRGAGPADDAQVRLLERGALVIALSLVQQRALTEAAHRSRGELLTALVDGGEPELLERRAAGMGVDLSRPFVLALAEGTDSRARPLCAELARRHGGLTVDRGERVLLLLPADADLGPLLPHATVGVSAPVSCAAGVPEAFQEARRCLQTAIALGRENVLASPETLGMYRFLLAPGGRREAEQFVRRTLGPLLEHDRERGTDLARTLEEYLASGRQHTATAEVLHIHPNTLYQRLARIGSVLGEQWREADRALDLHVALRLHRLGAALGEL